MKINNFFAEEYLTVGNTYDNFIFENCSVEFLHFAKSKLKECNNNTKSCVVYVNKLTEYSIEPILNSCTEDFQQKILARDFITALVINQLLKHTTNQEAKDFVDAQIAAFLNGNFEQVKQLHSQSYMPHDVKRISKQIGKIEICFILEDTQNKLLQQAINVFISAREPYCVKVFTNNPRLPSYYDLNGNIIECPHDFMRRDVNQFIDQSSSEK